MSINRVIKLFVLWMNQLFSIKASISIKNAFSFLTRKRPEKEYKWLGMAVVLVLSSICLYSCDADSSYINHDGDSSIYAKKVKSKYDAHRKTTSSSDSSSDNWFVDDTQITVSTGNFWDRLRGSFQLQHQCDNPKVKAQIKWYIRHQAYLNRSVKRASPYMYYIFEQVQKRNLPGELILLPFVESAFNPFAYSGPGAAGIWQIMPHTGTGFGLKQNWWYDGRRDIHASTNAALDYLTYLESFFDGNWLLAIAAYNTGEGNVQHAVRRNARMGLNTDFFSLGLAQETQAYVPQLLALAAIISNPEEYSIKLPPVRDEAYLAEVNIGYQIDLNEAAQLACISTDEIHHLNPAYIHKLTGPRSACCLLLPIDHVETFKKNLAKLSVVNQTSLQRYKVKRHESVESIAARFQISSYKLRRINHLKVNALRPGRTIFIPVESPRITGNIKEKDRSAEDVQKIDEKSSTVSENIQKTETSENVQEAPVIADEGETPANPHVSPSRSKKVLHRVKRGETLQRIAAHYHVKTRDLQKWNHLSKKARLKPGKTLVVIQKVQSSERVTISKQKTYHNEKIAEKKLRHHKAIKATIKQQPQKQKTPHLVRVSYKVRAGETLPHVAKKCHVSVTEIQRWNHLARRTARPGQVLTIYLRS